MVKLTLGKVVDRFVELYNEIADQPHIKKPLAYSLYWLWKWVDANEPERKNEDE